MKKQKNILHVLVIAFTFFVALFIMASFSKQKEFADKPGPYYPYDLFVPGFILTINNGY